MKQLLSEQQLREGVRRLADEISAYYDRQPLTVIGVLTGSIVLLTDLVRQLEMPLKIGVVQANSYRGTVITPGPLRISLDFMPDISRQNVLIVDDIFDTGHTMAALLEKLGAHEPESLRSAVLLRKAGRVEVPLQPDHVAFEIPNEFVVGYGLDYADLHRNLPYVASLEPADLANPSLEDARDSARATGKSS